MVYFLNDLILNTRDCDVKAILVCFYKFREKIWFEEGSKRQRLKGTKFYTSFTSEPLLL